MRTWVGRSEVFALRHSARLFADTPNAIPVDECAYNMQVAECCMDADCALMAEGLTDSTVSPDWQLILANMPTVRRDKRAQRFKEEYRLNGPDRAQRARISHKWEQMNPQQRAELRKRYRTKEWRDMDNARRRAKRAEANAASFASPANPGPTPVVGESAAQGAADPSASVPNLSSATS
jgi:hypothetical protein